MNFVYMSILYNDHIRVACMFIISDIHIVPSYKPSPCSILCPSQYQIVNILLVYPMMFILHIPHIRDVTPHMHLFEKFIQAIFCDPSVVAHVCSTALGRLRQQEFKASLVQLRLTKIMQQCLASSQFQLPKSGLLLLLSTQFVYNQKKLQEPERCLSS